MQKSPPTDRALAVGAATRLGDSVATSRTDGVVSPARLWSGDFAGRQTVQHLHPLIALRLRRPSQLPRPLTELRPSGSWSGEVRPSPVSEMATRIVDRVAIPLTENLGLLADGTATQLVTGTAIWHTNSAITFPTNAVASSLVPGGATRDEGGARRTQARRSGDQTR